MVGHVLCTSYNLLTTFFLFFTMILAHLVSGIFRKSGSHEVVEDLKKRYSSPTGKIGK